MMEANDEEMDPEIDEAELNLDKVHFCFLNLLISFLHSKVYIS